MNIKKKICIVSAPVDTYSGYGARSRDVVKSLVKMYPEWDVQVLAQRWGNTRTGYLEHHGEEEIYNLIIPKVESKPDIWIQITIPNEFQRVGQFNIGITAGIETNMADPSWIEGCNRMDLNLVSSNHSKKTLTQYTYEVKDPKTGETRPLRCTSPVEVLFEGLDLTKYYQIKEYDKTSDINKALDSIQEDFCFLAVGHWLVGDFGQDRKNIGGTIKAFLEAFKDRPVQPALVIKTQSANASIMDRDAILKKIEEVKSKVDAKKLPNIYLLHGEISDEEMNILYNHPKIKVMISLFKGEGFGRPLLEFASLSKPIISSMWSGPLDFLSPEFTYFVGGKLEPVHKSAQVQNMILNGSQWFSANESEAIKLCKLVYSKEYKQALIKAKRQGHRIRTTMTLEDMGNSLKSSIDKIIKEYPFQVELNLPKLPELTRIS